MLPRRSHQDVPDLRSCDGAQGNPRLVFCRFSLAVCISRLPSGCYENLSLGIPSASPFETWAWGPSLEAGPGPGPTRTRKLETVCTIDRRPNAGVFGAQCG